MATCKYTGSLGIVSSLALTRVVDGCRVMRPDGPDTDASPLMWTAVGDFNYTLHTQPKSFGDAHRVCNRAGGELASFPSRYAYKVPVPACQTLDCHHCC